jgi:pyridoxamine 5'-phosphate oxidase
MQPPPGTVRSARVDHVARLRTEYTRAGLAEVDAAPDPLAQFRAWFEEALAADLHEPNAMVLATATPDGKPSARVVLLKGFDERGFVFYTNYEGRKGREIGRNPHAALVFYWGELERQVRIEGRVGRVSERESDAYYASRPRGSRLGAWASEQSRVVGGREVLEGRIRDLEAEYEGREVPRPAFWGGYRVEPEVVEFWQGRESRLHDRISYRRGDGGWEIERLQP